MRTKIFALNCCHTDAGTFTQNMEPSIKHCLQAVNLQNLLRKLRSGDTGLPGMTTKSSVRPILIVNGSVLLRISTSTHRSSCSTHSPQNEIVEWGYWASCDNKVERSTDHGSILMVQSCHEFRRVHIAVLVGYSPTHDDNISGPKATGSVLLRISTSTHRSSLSTRSPQIQIAKKWGYLATGNDNKDGPSTDSYNY
ncbi:hypothetical protein HZH68_008432 [Vespula germanica]|uniref:Uncharacterized protein n=1 Tax=Vespula germanica TaxID=30212 RepID=A0A834JZT7_VESGE|nr:hypothetical protein HZH68_008432 [Vespula germanica]